MLDCVLCPICGKRAASYSRLLFVGSGNRVRCRECGSALRMSRLLSIAALLWVAFAFPIGMVASIAIRQALQLPSPGVVAVLAGGVIASAPALLLIYFFSTLVSVDGSKPSATPAMKS